MDFIVCWEWGFHHRWNWIPAQSWNDKIWRSIMENTAKYTVLNPRGSQNDVKLYPLSQRLPTLEGKTVYCIAQDRPVFMEHLAQQLPEFIPGVRIVFKNKPGGFTGDDPELREEIIHMADALIYGTAMGGGSGMFGTGWTVEVEKRGIPSVYIVGEPFLSDILVSAKMRGMPALRLVPIQLVEEVNVAQITHQQYSGISSRIAAALTGSLNAEEKNSGTVVFEKPPRIGFTGTFEEVQDYFINNRMSDGLPVVPPTEESVTEFLKHTRHSPNEVVTTTMWPEEWQVTVEKVAAVGVMAGCKPEYLPVLLAIVEAWGKDTFFKLLVRSGSSASPIIFINGPVRNEIGMNAGLNALGPGNRANASIGRFMRLAIINLGGSWPGVNDMSAQGSPTKYGFCFAENEEGTPWQPFHTSRGFKTDESAVTVLIGAWAHSNLFSAGQSSELILEVLAKSILALQGRHGALILMGPGMARLLKENGMSKADVERQIWKHAVETVSELKLHMPGQGRTDYVKLADDALIQAYPNESAVRVVIVGGETGQPIAQPWQFNSQQTVSIDKWR
jgi:hypothetical protein